MARLRKGSRWAPVIIIFFLLATLLVLKQCRQASPENNRTTGKTVSGKTITNPKGLDRNPAAIHYSKHARCRMECRHIDESEVKEILKTGKINYAKSDIGDNPDCRKKYAVEGKTRDQQQVRIIFAPCQSEVTVVTVIDLGTEWKCDCN